MHWQLAANWFRKASKFGLPGPSFGGTSWRLIEIKMDDNQAGLFVCKRNRERDGI